VSDVVESRRLFEAGAKAFQEGRYEDALDAFTAAHEKNPVADFKFNQAVCLEKLGRPYAAADRYQAYVAAKPDARDAAQVTARTEKLRSEADAKPITATGAAGGQEWMSRGNHFLASRRYDEAVAAFQEGFRTYPDSKFILNEAAALLDGGRYAEADLAYQRYLSDPNAPRADEARAAQQNARAHMGGREATITGVAQAGHYFEKGTALYKDGRYAEALEAFDRAYELSPSPELRYNQAACLDRLGRRDEAAKRYDEYVAERPRAPDAAKVQAHAQKLHAEAAAFSRAAFDRAQIAFQEGRFGDAAIAFGEAYGHVPHPEFLYNRAQAFDKAGDTAKAVREYQLYLNARPDAADADKVRARIHELQRMTGSDLMRP
jgi:tetratricopeptide (TPR) repeat protein